MQSTLNTEKKKKGKEKRERARKQAKGYRHRKGRGKNKGTQRELSAGVVSKKKKGLETENLLFLPLVSCRDCEVNGFEMEWVYELVARSQEERDRQDCFVNSDPLNFSVNLKRNVSPLSGSYSFPL